MASEWPLVSLDALVRRDRPITYGVVKPGAEDETGVLFVRGGDISNGRIAVEQLRTISQSVSDQYGRTLLQGGELLISLVGNPGEVAIAPPSLKGANIARQVGLVALNDSVSSEYIKYFLSSPLGKGRLVAQSLGSVQSVINLRDLRNIEIPLPDIEIQKEIASTLSALDGRIDLLRQTNATLEAIAQALFKSWFVDFDPVRAKAEGREPEGMDAETAALFPSEFEESELGAIPKGWTIRPFTSEFEFTMGQSPPGDSYNDSGDGTPFFQGCTDFGDVSPRLRVFTTQPTRFARTGDVLMSVRAPVGDINVASSDCSIGRGLCSIRHRSGSTGLTVASIGAMRARIETAAGEGALFKSLSKKQLSELPVISFGDHLAHAGSSVLDPLVRSRLANAKRIEVLTSLRDTLLPRLISGRLRLPDVESAIEEALA